MTLFMTFAACYGVIQLAALGWVAGRSARIGTLLLAVATGLYGCGVASILLQILYTRGVAAITGDHLFEVVRVAGYTVDPFIEEIVKLAPLLVLGMHLKTRVQWGMTDYVLLGAAFGAGFGLLEAILRFSHRAGTAIDFINGWIVPAGLSAVYIPDLGTTFTSWLPAPASSEGLAFVTSPDTFLHLAWSAVGGIGVAIILRGKGILRLLGLLPIAFVGAEHAALNYDLTALGRNLAGDAITAPLLALHEALWLYPLVALGIAAFFDRRDLARAKAASPGLYRAGLFEFSTLRLPWTLLITLRYIRLRRSLAFAAARAQADRVAQWQREVEGLRQLIDRASTAGAWSRAPKLGELRSRLRVKPLPLIIWLVLLVPSLVFLVLGGFPGTASLQKALTTAPMQAVLVVFLAAGLAWAVWQLLMVLRALPSTLRHQYGDVAARGYLRLLTIGGSLIGGGYALMLAITGARLTQRPISTLHVLAALAGAILMVLLVMALISFPPGGMMMALATGGALAEGITISATGWAAIAGTGALSGWLLAEAAEGGSLGDSGGGRSEPPERGSRDWRLEPNEADPHAQELGYDHATGRFSVREAETGIRIETQEGVQLQRSTEPWADYVDPATGTTYDAVGNFEAQYFEQQWPRLQNQIVDHLTYADRVPVDVSRFTPNQVQQVAQFIEQNGIGSRVFIVGG